jgi:uncharacterized protein (TIRG00374 family)
VAVAYLVWDVGPQQVWEVVRTLSWRLALVLAIPYGLTTTLDTLAWRLAFPGRRPPFAAAWGARIAGEAVNLLTPTASVGGEPVKAYLLRRWVPLRDGLSAVVVDKTMIVTGQGGFLILGLVVALSVTPVPGPLLTAMSVLLALEALAVAGFVLVQVRGVAGGAGRLLARLGLSPGRAGQAALDGLDRRLAGLYARRRRRLAAAAVVHLLAWTLGSLEVYLVLRFAGVAISPLTAVLLESFGTAVKFATFMIPGSLGALEGGNVAIFAGLGLGGAAGLSYTLIRRLREALWAGLGMLAMTVLSRPRRRGGPGADLDALC